MRVGNAWKVRESDLPLLAQPIGAAPTVPTDASSAQPESLGDLAEIARELVSTWPRLTEDQKVELGRLLTPAA